jgi:hypothetical protein
VRLTWWAMWGAERRTCVNMHARGGCQICSILRYSGVFYIGDTMQGWSHIWIRRGHFSVRSSHNQHIYRRARIEVAWVCI